MTDRAAIRALIEAVDGGAFPADTSGRDIGSPDISVAYAAFGGSLDAALALHEAVLPGWLLALLSDVKIGPPLCATGRWCARVWEIVGRGGYSAVADTPARSWLLAILKAMEAEV